MEKSRLCCRSCGAPIGKIDPSQEIVVCPFCHSVNQVADLLGDSDEVRKEKIKARTEAELEAMRLKEETRRKILSNRAHQPKFTVFSDIIWNFLPYLLGIAAFNCLLFAGYAIMEEKAYVTGSIGILQTLLLGIAAITGYHLNTRKRANIMIALALLLVLPWALTLEASSKRPKDPIVWQDLVLADRLPVPGKCFGDVSVDDLTELEVELNGQEKIDYLRYQQACQEKGLTVDAREMSDSYSAYDPEGYHLQISYFHLDNLISITLHAPMQFEPLQWPEGHIGTLIPKPPADLGLTQWVSEDDFCIYVGEITEESYAAYVEELRNLGFEERSGPHEWRFSGKNRDGITVDADYEGFRTMRLNLSLPARPSE